MLSWMRKEHDTMALTVLFLSVASPAAISTGKVSAEAGLWLPFRTDSLLLISYKTCIMSFLLPQLTST